MTSLASLACSANLLLPIGVWALATCLAQSRRLREQVNGHLATLAHDLGYLQSPLPARNVLLSQFGLAISLVALAVGLDTLLPLPLLLGVALGPRLYLNRKRRSRTTRIEQQLDTWLLALSNTLKASPSLGEGIASSARLMAPPLCEELALLLNEVRLGMPLDRALRQMTERAKSPVVSAAIATLRVARNAGGNLSETLEAAAASLREMARLEGVVRTKTAEGRAQSLLIGVIPVPLVFMLDSLNPKLLEPLWSTARGHLVLGAAGLLWLAALLWARKIVAVDI